VEHANDVETPHRGIATGAQWFDLARFRAGSKVVFPARLIDVL
jgi:hypothetical protein